MFDNKLFEDWLDGEATKAMEKITQGNTTTPNEMMILVLKAQTNHIAHMETDLRGEMIALREDMDKRFEQIDKRFDNVISRIDSFMKWSFSTTLIVGGLVVATIRYLP